jgi:CelD/BcsL family acetyltransferase involved in cellulose biosynthesis
MGGYDSTTFELMRVVAAQRTSRLKIEVLGDLQGIIPEWWELFRRCYDATPFQSPAWLLPWWKFFGRGEPLIVTARLDNQLCGLTLLYIYETERERPQLFFIGKAVSDYLDVLIAPDEHRIQVAQQLLNCAFSSVGLWHSAELDRLPPNSPLLQIQHRPGFSIFRTCDGVCPQLPIGGHKLEEFIKRKSTLINLRNRRRRAEKAGAVDFVTADASSIDVLMHDLLRLHSKRWNSIGLAGMFSDASMTVFLAEAAHELLAAGMLRLHAMRLNDETIAVSFGMIHRDRAYLYNFGFDPAYSAIAPATQVIAFAIERAAQEGTHIFDFLQGDESYKFATWGAVPYYTYRLRYFPSNLGASDALIKQTMRGGKEMTRDARNEKDERSPERKGDLEAQPDEFGTDPAQVGLEVRGKAAACSESSH